MSDKNKALRRQIRVGRLALPSSRQAQAAQAAAANLLASDLLDKVRHIALYAATAGELDPKILLESCWKLGKLCYYPILNESERDASLVFAPVTPNSEYKPNYFDILEPEHNEKERLLPEQVDLVITPLVAFDSTGNRLGMGKGFYDKSFAFNMTGNKPSVPLIGYAHGFQQVEELDAEAWDVPLTAVVTETEVITF